MSPSRLPHSLLYYNKLQHEQASSTLSLHAVVKMGLQIKKKRSKKIQNLFCILSLYLSALLINKVNKSRHSKTERSGVGKRQLKREAKGADTVIDEYRWKWGMGIFFEKHFMRCYY